MATEPTTADRLRDLAEDITEEWAAGFPVSRFSGLTVETARMSVSPQEVVDLVASALAVRHADGEDTRHG